MLVQNAFTPCLQYAYAAGKNTSDLAFARDAIEALFDHRAGTFCLVTSDSDFAGLCRKPRERGATVHVIGEANCVAQGGRSAPHQHTQAARSENQEAGELVPDGDMIDVRQIRHATELLRQNAMELRAHS